MPRSQITCRTCGEFREVWTCGICPREGVLAAVLAMARCLRLSVSLRLSVTSRSSIETAEQIELVFGTGAFFHVSYTTLKENSSIFKNKSTSLWKFFPNSGKFCFDISIIETCYRLSWRKVDAHCVINWSVVGQLS